MRGPTIVVKRKHFVLALAIWTIVFALCTVFQIMNALGGESSGPAVIFGLLTAIGIFYIFKLPSLEAKLSAIAGIKWK
jgi:hypothetical protein